MRFSSLILFIVFFLFTLELSGQEEKIISGPVQGATTSTTAKFQLMVAHTSEISIKHPEKREVLDFIVKMINDTMGVATVFMEDLLPGKKYELELNLDGNSETGISFPFRTFENDISDFSFLLGSCTFPHKPRKKKWGIFDTMSKVKSDLMLWMGDNIYLILGDWKSREKIYERYVKYRSHPKLNGFLTTRPNYAAWDDHDFGSNNSGADFENKHITFEAFQDFWPNPAYGNENLGGTFYSFVHQDVEFFILDGRSHYRGEELYGQKQLEWLKEGLRNSNASVKFIVGGTQFFVNGGESWDDFPEEKKSFLDFWEKEKIEGIVFLSGDRHFAELTIIEKEGLPKIVEVTTSPLTSFVNKFFNLKNPNRVEGTLVKKNNFGHIFLEGKGKERKIRIEIRGRDGSLFWEHELLVDELK